MHIVHGKLRKEPTVKQLAESVMFIIELAEMIKDRKTGEKTYTNYKAMLFAKTQAAVDYYTKATAVGSYIVLNSEKLKIDKFEANSGITYITLLMENAKLEGVNIIQNEQQQAPQQAPSQSWGNAPQQAASAPQQQVAPQVSPAYQSAPHQAPKPQQQAPAQYSEPSMGVDNDPIPF